MNLLTIEIETILPTISSVEQQPFKDLVAVVKFFHPVLKVQWFVFGGDHVDDDYMFYGIIFHKDRPKGKICYFTLSEFEDWLLPFAGSIFGVKHDKLFKPTPASKLSC